MHPSRALPTTRVPSLAALSLALALLGARAPAAIAQAVTQRVVTGGDAWVDVCSDGMLGNDFTSPSPSFEYPIGTGFEHLVHGGLWVGAITDEGFGPFTGVVTGALDQPVGSFPGSLSEWTPLSAGFTVRSNQPGSAFYDPAALSPDESLVLYDDRAPKTTLANPEPHQPVGLRVRQVTHAWNEPGYRDLVVLRFIVTSEDVPPIQNVWVGIYAELASGARDLYTCWPPSGSCGPGGWFSKKLLGWDPDWRMLREHYCRSQPEPDSCHFELVPPWAGLQLLTPPGPGQHVTLAAWNYSPGDPARDTDAERYAIMSAGTIADVSDPSLQPPTGDPVELLAVGPFTLPGPDDSLEVAFALVGGADLPSLRQHARSAQALHDAGYRLALVDAGPPPRPPARLSLAALANPSRGGEPAFTLELPAGGRARLELLDLAGRRIASRELGVLPAGRHTVALPGGSRLPPGVYLARVTAGDGEASARFVRLR